MKNINRRKFIKFSGLFSLIFVFNPFSFFKKKFDINNISVSTKKLDCLWTIELEEDLEAIYGLDCEKELNDILFNNDWTADAEL